MEKQMNYTFIPSSEHKTLVETTIKLWNQDDIRDLLSEFYFPLLFKCMSEWQKIENKVIEKVPELLLPEHLEKKVLDFIKPIGLQILK